MKTAGWEMTFRARKNFSRLLERYGYQINSTRKTIPADYRGRTLSAAFAYLDNEKNPVLVDVSPGACRNWLGLPFSVGIDNHIPGVLREAFTLNEGEAQGVVVEFIEADLKRWRSRSVAEALGLAESQVPALRGVSSYNHVFPWSRRSFSQRAASRYRKHLEQAARYEMDLPSAPNGKESNGYASGVAAVKARQYLTIWQSLKENGYQRHDRADGDICVDILLAEGNEAFFVRSGNHRLHVLAALEYPEVPVRVCGLVRRDEAEMWPQVQRGVMSVASALKVFDRILSGRGPTLDDSRDASDPGQARV